MNGKANNTGDGHLGYLLLAGDAYLDYNSTEMLPAAYPPFYDSLEHGSDYYYACTGGDSDNLLDIMYGRLPAGNENELSNEVNKIIDYEYNNNRSWRYNITFVAGSHGLFYSYAELAIERMSELIPSNFTKTMLTGRLIQTAVLRFQELIQYFPKDLHWKNMKIPINFADQKN